MAVNERTVMHKFSDPGSGMTQYIAFQLAFKGRGACFQIIKTRFDASQSQSQSERRACLTSASQPSVHVHGESD